jgi:uncharacterized ferritin-like protein (DUF455 family)
MLFVSTGSFVDLADIARSILLGIRWEDKLLADDHFTDIKRTAFTEVPSFPGRPHQLRLEEKSARAKVSFPKLDELSNPTSRGRLLHFFANHELLAMELMALMLLKFPDAPTAFRAGIARSIFEEQTHLKLYVGRMRELGVDFGELPVSDYFWKAMKDMTSPLQFVTQMSLTLEQANLDFSLFYQRAVAACGDDETAAILERVYREEIGHVKHGLSWFNRWREGPGPGPDPDHGEDDWDAYLRLLPPPMTPVRAKGLSFSAESRRLAGFSERFIQELEVHGGSKGRPPVLWTYNPMCDFEIARGKTGFTPSGPAKQMTLDLEHLPMHFAREQDAVLVHELPRAEWLREMRETGFTIPEFRPHFTAGRNPRENKIGGFEPWGWSPEPFELFKPWRDRLIRVEGTNYKWCQQLLNHENFSDTQLGDYFSKSWSSAYLRAWLEKNPEDQAVFGPLETVGQTYLRWNEAKQKLESVLASASPSDTWVAKAPWGTSGTQNKKISKISELNSNFTTWIQGTIETQGGIVLEPWLDKQADVSMQMVIESQSTSILGIRRFINGKHSEYRGTYLDPKLSSLGPEMLRFLHDPALGMPMDRWREFARKLGETLRTHYQGPAGIDAMIWKDPRSGRLFLKPLVELNPRWTMGRVALEIEKHVVPGVQANWIFLPVRELQKRGLPEALSDAVRALRKKHPLRTETGTSGHRISEGVLFTNDPEQARTVLTILAVGPRAIADEALLTE